jgi:hypothetical protein
MKGMFPKENALAGMRASRPVFIQKGWAGVGTRRSGEMTKWL